VQGGPAVGENEDIVAKMQEIIDEARKASCVYAEIRCFEDYSPYRTAFEQAGWVYCPHYDVIIDPRKEVPEAKMRQIRKALDEGEQWRETKSEQDIQDWYSCLRKLYCTKIHRPLPKYAFFCQMILQKACRLLVVEHQGKIVGGVMLAVEEDKRKAYEWYICGQVMSTWAAIEWCRQQGIGLFDTMGAGVPGVPYGVRDFKLQMGGQLYEWGRYIYVLKPRVYALGKWLMDRHA